jgi:DNA-binding CsgD family transcriptional regulator
MEDLMNGTGRPERGSNRLGDAKAIVRLVGHADANSSQPVSESVVRKRRLVADLCRLLGSQLNGAAPVSQPRPVVPTIALPDDGQSLSPRVQQTLARMLVGDSEKQIAIQLGVSRHTVHCYVKSLYRRFKVSSRGELLARFIESAPRR